MCDLENENSNSSYGKYVTTLVFLRLANISMKEILTPSTPFNK